MISLKVFSINCKLQNQLERCFRSCLKVENLKNTRYVSTTTSNKDDTEKLYYGTLTQQIRAVKFVSFTTSIGGLIAQPILIQKVTTTGASVPVLVGLCSFFGFFTFVTPFLLHMITKRYVTHLDYDPKSQKYIATILTFFCREKKVEFTLEDVKVPEVPGMFTTFVVKGQELFVDPKLFTDPTHYGKLMGYYKPIDYKLYQTEVNKKHI